MYLSRVRIQNFRNFQDLDVALGGNVVIDGENRVEKSNLLFGLRLIFDPALPDSSRLLGLADFRDDHLCGEMPAQQQGCRADPPPIFVTTA